MLPTFIAAILLCTLGVVAQNAQGSSISWFYPDRITLANSEGNSNPNRPVSSLNDTLWDLNLTRPFSITAWLRVSDRRFWRAAISIESSDATYALFQISLPPDQSMFNVAWMRNAQARGGAINTTAVAPGPNVDFHFALVKDNQDMTIYLDGVRRARHTISGQIYNPREKQVVLGRTKVNGALNRDQWSGTIRDVNIWRGALTAEDVVKQRDNSRE